MSCAVLSYTTGMHWLRMPDNPQTTKNFIRNCGLSADANILHPHYRIPLIYSYYTAEP